MSKIGWIRLDIFDCADGERRFRVYGDIDDMLETDMLGAAMQYLKQHVMDITGKVGHVDVHHPRAMDIKVYLNGEKVDGAVEADDVEGWVKYMYKVDSSDINITHKLEYGDIKIVIDDSS